MARPRSSFEHFVQRIEAVYSVRAWRRHIRRARVQMRRYDALATSLRSATGRPVALCPQFDPRRGGDLSSCDPSFKCEIVVSEEVADPLDWDQELAASCPRGVELCDIWISVAAPWFVVDPYRMSWSRASHVWEFQAQSRARRPFQRVARAVTDVLGNAGFTELPRAWLGRRIPGVRTECSDGDATVFDCLFSDVSALHDGTVRFTSPDLTELIPQARIGWRQREGRSGRSCECTIHLDSGAVVQLTWTGDGDPSALSIRTDRSSGEADVEWRRPRGRDPA